MKIEARSLNKRYGAHHALHGAGFVTPDDAGCVVLLGPSGSGKSTLLRVLGSLLVPDGGEVRLDDQALAWSEADTLRQRRENGFVFQSFNLFPHLTVLQNIVLAPMKVRGLTLEAAELLAMELLKKVGITEASIPSHLP